MSFLDILGAFVPLIIIVALLYGALIFVRKYGYNQKGKEVAPVNIKVVSTKMIMPKKFVSIIKIEDSLLVLGISENSISLLKEIENTSENLTLNSDQLKSNNHGESFIEILKKNFGMK